MDYEEFVRWTTLLVEEGLLTVEQAEDVREQRAQFDRDRQSFELEFGGRVVGLVAGDLLVYDTAVELLDASAGAYGSHLVYFEPIAGALVGPPPIRTSVSV